MGNLLIPANLLTVVNWCCEEIEDNGATAFGEALSSNAAGVYAFSVMLPWALDTTLDFVAAADATPGQTLNGPTPIPVTWDTNAAGDGSDFLHVFGASEMTCRFTGSAEFSVVLAVACDIDNHDSIEVYFRQSFIGGGSIDLPAHSFVTLNTHLGNPGVGTAVASVTCGVTAGDVIEVMSLDGTGGAPIGVIQPLPFNYSNFTGRRLSLPPTFAYVDLHDADGTLIRNAAEARGAGRSQTFTLTGIAVLTAGQKLITKMFTEWQDGITVDELAQSQLHWIGPVTAWNHCTAGSPT